MPQRNRTGTECITVPDPRPIPEPGLDPDPTLNVKKIKNERPTFWEIVLLLMLQGKILYKFFVVGNLCYILSGSGTETGVVTETKTFPTLDP